MIFRKIFLLAFICCSFSLTGFSQINSPLVDKGFQLLLIDKTFSELKPYLTPVDKKTFRDTTEENMFDDPYASVWMFDFKKAKMEEFFGPNITSIEVFFVQGVDDEGAPTKEQYLGEFIIYFEKPATAAAENDFKTKLLNFYGPPIIANAEDGSGPMNYGWYNETTALQVDVGYTNEKKSGLYRAVYTNNGG